MTLSPPRLAILQCTSIHARVAKSHSQNERHTYEKCQYDEFKKRVAKMDEIRAAKGGARSN